MARERNDARHLSWFLGPKAENAGTLEDLLLLAIRDYIHWRRNYFPADKSLITKLLQRELTQEYDEIHQKLIEMTALLRRNFPFYSPRYIAHMLSDVSIPSLLGAIAGLMYNPNNVTTEAAPVTVEWEIDACNSILRMLGIKPSPAPKAQDESEETYQKRLAGAYGWAHTTLGGTTANIEALWVARNLRVFPYLVKQAAKANGVQVKITVQRNGQSQEVDIRKATDEQVLSMAPAAAIELLDKYIAAVAKSTGLVGKPNDASAKAWSYIRATTADTGSAYASVFSKWRPIILASAAAHYSIAKAADVLGIGAENVISIPVDSSFRMNMKDLESRIRRSHEKGEVIIAVVGIVGTTEEGAVDPIHEIADLRKRLECNEGRSFWFHVDAAYGGYLRSLFNFEEADASSFVFERIVKSLGMSADTNMRDWSALLIRLIGTTSTPIESNRRRSLEEAVAALKRIESIDAHQFNSRMRRFLQENRDIFQNKISEKQLRITLEDRIGVVSNYVSEAGEIVVGKYSTMLDVRWGDREVCSAIIAIGSSDSITVDPHKLGYVPYPCGVVAFRNDRVRRFVWQHAPYITAVSGQAAVHLPPRYRSDSESTSNTGHITAAFGPFILEGSRPGASACALWLATETIPLTMRKHGAILKDSLLAARWLFEWLGHWQSSQSANGHESVCEFVPLITHPPDTNVVVFCVRPAIGNTLKGVNRVTEGVYKKFTILAELGDREFSYQQPFFLSKTRIEERTYSYESVRNFLHRCVPGCGKEALMSQYSHEGVVVLRAAVMSPYLVGMRRLAGQDLIQEFVETLGQVARQESRTEITRSAVP